MQDWIGDFIHQLYFRIGASEASHVATLIERSSIKRNYRKRVLEKNSAKSLQGFGGKLNFDPEIQGHGLYMGITKHPTRFNEPRPKPRSSLGRLCPEKPVKHILSGASPQSLKT